jgi:ribonuclease P/MRP protein subunit POP5
MITHLCKPLDTPCVFQVVRVSGTIRKSEEEAIRRARDVLRRAKAEGGAGNEDVLDIMMVEADVVDAGIVSGSDDDGEEQDEDD